MRLLQKDQSPTALRVTEYSLAKTLVRLLNRVDGVDASLHRSKVGRT
jgi:hypothetical protein